jgi:GNAT superfamily N-acetyltransferase
MLTFAKAQTSAEFARLSTLAYVIWTNHYTPIIGSAQVTYMLEKYQSPRAIAEQVSTGTTYYLLRYHAEDAGYVAFSRKEDCLFLSKLYVGKAWRGKGLARAAMDFVGEQARTLGCHRIQLTVNKGNTDSIRVYQHLGFRQTAAIVIDIGQGFVMDDFVMERAI